MIDLLVGAALPVSSSYGSRLELVSKIPTESQPAEAEDFLIFFSVGPITEELD